MSDDARQEWQERRAKADALLAQGELGLALLEIDAALAGAPEDQREGLRRMQLETRAKLWPAAIAAARELFEEDPGASALDDALDSAEALVDSDAHRAEMAKLRAEVARVREQRATDALEHEVEVTRVSNPAEVDVVRGLLESAGIMVRSVGEFPSGVLPLSVDGLAEVRILVPESRAAEAREVLAAARREGKAAAGDDADTP